MMHALFYVSAAVSIGYVLYEFFYFRQMHAYVPLYNGVLVGIVGLILSFFG